MASLLAAFALRLLYLLLSGRAIDSPDSIHYIAMAQQFRAGDFLSFDENLPVLYSALGALAHLILGDWERAFWAVSLLCSTLTVIPIYLISRELHGQRAARVMAALVCAWPWLVDYASRVQPEALAVLLWFSSVWSVYLAITRGRGYLAVAPAVLFALHLSRPEGTFLMLGAPLGALLLCSRQDSARFRRLIVLAVSVAALMGVYALTMKGLVGTATVSYRAPMAGDLSDYFRRGAVEFVRTFFRLTFDVLPVMLGPFLLVFMGLGVFSRPKEGHTIGLERFVLYFCGIQYALAIANVSPSPRYLMPVILSFAMWSAFGMIRARDKLLTHGRRHLAALPAALVFGAMGLGLAAGIAGQHMRRIPSTPVEYRLAGKWMAENLEPGLIFARKPQIGFYAGMPSIGLGPEDGIEELLAKAEETGARYVVVDERYGTKLTPGIMSLLDPAAAPESLRLLRDDLSQWDGAKVVVYEIAIPGMRYLPPEEFSRPDSHMGPDARRRTVSPEG